MGEFVNWEKGGLGHSFLADRLQNKKNIEVCTAHPRKGFTLVELIVVIVILGILLAISVPALTGYIDKAQMAGLESRARTLLMGIQTELDIYVGQNGGVVTYPTESALTTDKFFDRITEIPTGAPATPSGYYIARYITIAGAKEYAKLTGDNESFSGNKADGNQYRNQFVQALVDSTGAIKAFWYFDGCYYDKTATYSSSVDAMLFVYFADIESTDPATESVLTAVFGSLSAAKAVGASSGMGIFRCQVTTPPVVGSLPSGTWTRLN